MGCRWYCFRGEGPSGSHDQYKRKFNPQLAELIGYYDFPFLKSLYKLFYLNEFIILPMLYPLITRTRRLLVD